MINNNIFFVGVDLGDKYSHLTTIDQDGQLVEESRLQSTRQAFERKFSNTDRCRIAMEVGSHSRWASHLLNELGHDVLVANARKLIRVWDIVVLLFG